MAEKNRQLSRYSDDNRVTQHVAKGHGSEHFLDNPEWSKFVNGKIVHWKKRHEWVVNAPPNHRVMVVSFESLKQDKVAAVQRMLKFLDFDVSGELLW